VVPDTARQFRPRHRDAQPEAAGHHRRAAAAYRERILAALPPGTDFEPLMTLYLTDNTPAARSTARRPPASCMR
jgi:dihydroorotase